MHKEGEEMVSCQLLISLGTCGSVWLCKIELRPITSDSVFSWNLIWGSFRTGILKVCLWKARVKQQPLLSFSLSLSLSFFFFLAFVECVFENWKNESFRFEVLFSSSLLNETGLGARVNASGIEVKSEGQFIFWFPPPEPRWPIPACVTLNVCWN